MSDTIEIIYKGARISFDTHEEEWVAKLNLSYIGGEDKFKKHKSLQKLKDAIDRFNKKEFKEIPILICNNYGEGEMKNADIISFTEIEGECWIRYHNGSREKINTVSKQYASSKRLYACGNIVNEPILLDIERLNNEIKIIDKELQHKAKERTRLISSLQQFDISGYAEEHCTEL